MTQRCPEKGFLESAGSVACMALLRSLLLLAGPLGQCHPIPDDPQLKAEMLKHARNHHRIHSRYNLPYQSAPGSDMAKVNFIRTCAAYAEDTAILRLSKRLSSAAIILSPNRA